MKKSRRSGGSKRSSSRKSSRSSFKPSRSGGMKFRSSKSSKPSRSKKLGLASLLKSKKPPRDGGAKVRPEGEEFVTEEMGESMESTASGCTGCGCLPGCALGTVATAALIVAVIAWII